MNRQKQSDLLSVMVAEVSAFAGDPISVTDDALPRQMVTGGEEP